MTVSEEMAAELANKKAEREALRGVIQQWNANRLDLFELSEPNEDLEFHGVMRFYFQDSGQKVATKCIRVASDATSQAVIETLIEKFRPDMRMLSVPEYALYEIHENGEERKLGLEEKPLLVQLNWHIDDREGRFLLRRIDDKTNAQGVGFSNADGSSFRRKLSKREKKQMKKQEKLSRLKSLEQDENAALVDQNGVAEKLYTELPETSFTRSISNPEAVMRRRRQQKLERKLQQFRSKDGGPDTGGTLKIYGEALCKDVPYKTLLLSVRDSAVQVVREMLSKYGLDKVDQQQYCLVQVNSESNISGGTQQEYILDDDECPLAILMNHPSTRGSIMFHVRRRPADYVPRKRKKKPSGKWNELDHRYEDERLPFLLELSPDGSDIPNGAGARHRLQPNVTEVGSERPIGPQAVQAQTLTLTGPTVMPRHCVIAFTENIVTLTPCSRDAHTYVNNQRIHQTTILQNGAIVKFGRLHTFRFIDPAPEERIRHRHDTARQIEYSYDRRSPDMTNQEVNIERYGSASVTPSNGQNLVQGQGQSPLDQAFHPPSPSKSSSIPAAAVAAVCLTRSPTLATESTHNYETTFDLDGNIETASLTSSRDGNRILQNDRQPRGTDPILPAVLEFLEETEDTFFHAVITDLEPSAPQFKLAPTYTLYLAARYRASTHYRPELQPTERAHRLTVTLANVANMIQRVIQERYMDASSLALWLANGSELLHMLKNDRHVGAFSTRAQDILTEAVHMAFASLVRCVSLELAPAMSQFMADADEPAKEAGVLQIFSNTMALLRRCRVNAALTIQLFSHLFHTINATAFNALVSNTNLCVRWFGRRLKARLNALETWAERQGLELASQCHLATIMQATHLLQAPKYNADELATLSSTCFKLNSLQVRALLQKYQPAADEPRLPAELIENVVRVAESVADTLARADGREIRLEEEPTLALALLLPEDGYSCEVIRGVPPGLAEFLMPLQRDGLCRMAAQPTSSGYWTIYMIDHHNNFRSPSAMSNRSSGFTCHTGSNATQPEIHVIQLHKSTNGMGLSIVAAKGAGQDRLGIYIKSVVAGGAADADGRLTAGDQLLKVDGQSLVGITQEKAAEYLVRTGPVVTLEVAKQGAIYHGLATLLSQPSPVMTRAHKVRPKSEYFETSVMRESIEQPTTSHSMNNLLSVSKLAVTAQHSIDSIPGATRSLIRPTNMRFSDFDLFNCSADRLSGTDGISPRKYCSTSEDLMPRLLQNQNGAWSLERSFLGKQNFRIGDDCTRECITSNGDGGGCGSGSSDGICKSADEDDNDDDNNNDNEDGGGNGKSSDAIHDNYGVNNKQDANSEELATKISHEFDVLFDPVGVLADEVTLNLAINAKQTSFSLETIPYIDQVDDDRRAECNENGCCVVNGLDNASKSSLRLHSKPRCLSSIDQLVDIDEKKAKKSDDRTKEIKNNFQLLRESKECKLILSDEICPHLEIMKTIGGSIPDMDLSSLANDFINIDKCWISPDDARLCRGGCVATLERNFSDITNNGSINYRLNPVCLLENTKRFTSEPNLTMFKEPSSRRSKYNYFEVTDREKFRNRSVLNLREAEIDWQNAVVTVDNECRDSLLASKFEKPTRSDTVEKSIVNNGSFDILSYMRKRGLTASEKKLSMVDQEAVLEQLYQMSNLDFSIPPPPYLFPSRNMFDDDMNHVTLRRFTSLRAMNVEQEHIKGDRWFDNRLTQQHSMSHPHLGQISQFSLAGCKIKQQPYSQTGSAHGKFLTSMLDTTYLDIISGHKIQKGVDFTETSNCYQDSIKNVNEKYEKCRLSYSAEYISKDILERERQITVVQADNHGSIIYGSINFITKLKEEQQNFVDQTDSSRLRETLTDAHFFPRSRRMSERDLPSRLGREVTAPQHQIHTSKSVPALHNVGTDGKQQHEVFNPGYSRASSSNSVTPPVAQPSPITAINGSTSMRSRSSHNLHDTTRTLPPTGLVSRQQSSPNLNHGQITTNNNGSTTNVGTGANILQGNEAERFYQNLSIYRNQDTVVKQHHSPSQHPDDRNLLQLQKTSKGSQNSLNRPGTFETNQTRDRPISAYVSQSQQQNYISSQSQQHGCAAPPRSQSSRDIIRQEAKLQEMQEEVRRRELRGNIPIPSNQYRSATYNMKPNITTQSTSNNAIRPTRSIGSQLNLGSSPPITMSVSSISTSGNANTRQTTASTYNYLDAQHGSYVTQYGKTPHIHQHQHQSHHQHQLQIQHPHQHQHPHSHSHSHSHLHSHLQQNHNQSQSQSQNQNQHQNVLHQNVGHVQYAGSPPSRGKPELTRLQPNGMLFDYGREQVNQDLGKAYMDQNQHVVVGSQYYLNISSDVQNDHYGGENSENKLQTDPSTSVSNEISIRPTLPEDGYVENPPPPPPPNTSTHPLYSKQSDSRYTASMQDPPRGGYYPTNVTGPVSQPRQYQYSASNPWQREEREKEQARRREAARQWRDQQIAELSTLSQRTSQQEEQLRALQLERDFQKRAEEAANQQDEDEECTELDTESMERNHGLLRTTHSIPEDRINTFEQNLSISRGNATNQSIRGNQSLGGSLMHSNTVITAHENGTPQQCSQNVATFCLQQQQQQQDNSGLHSLIDFQREQTNQMQNNLGQISVTPLIHIGETQKSLGILPTEDKEIYRKHDEMKRKQVEFDDSQLKKKDEEVNKQQQNQHMYQQQHHLQQSQLRSKTQQTLHPSTLRVDSLIINGSCVPSIQSANAEAPLPPERGSSYAIMSQQSALRSNNSNVSNTITLTTQQQLASVKRVSFHDSNVSVESIQQHVPPGGLVSNQVTTMDIIAEDLNNLISDAEIMSVSPKVSDAGAGVPIAGSTPGVIGAQEVYKDPRQRRLAEKQKQQQNSQVGQVPEKLSFKEKMKMFAMETGEDGTPRDKVKISRAQREIDNIGNPSTIVLNNSNNSANHNSSSNSNNTINNNNNNNNNNNKNNNGTNMNNNIGNRQK